MPEQEAMNLIGGGYPEEHQPDQQTDPEAALHRYDPQGNFTGHHHDGFRAGYRVEQAELEERRRIAEERIEQAVAAKVAAINRITELEGALRLYRVVVADALEWLDGHAAPKVTQEQIEGRLFSVQNTVSALLDAEATEGGSE